MSNKTWYMCVATGQDGMARSGWYESEREAAAEAMHIASTCAEVGDCSTIEILAEAPPDLGIMYSTDSEMCEDIQADLDEGGYDDGDEDEDGVEDA